MNSLRRHYPEYLMEAAGLGIFMIGASLSTVLVEYPASPIRQAIAEPFLRRLIIGAAMGLTAVAIIYSPWGKQSGAHINPAVTLTFFRLGKINRFDALFYGVAQCLGGLLGMVITAIFLRGVIADSTVNFIVTLPGSKGTTTGTVWLIWRG